MPSSIKRLTGPFHRSQVKREGRREDLKDLQDGLDDAIEQSGGGEIVPDETFQLLKSRGYTHEQIQELLAENQPALKPGS